MSQSAKLNGVVVEAERFQLNHWLEVQDAIRTGAAKVQMPFCGCRGHGAVSVLNRQFFKHYASEAHCEYASADESAEHLFAKKEIARGIKMAGWTASIEQASDPGSAARWRADVLATSDEMRAAFEVQRSWQAAHRYKRRAETYRESGIENVWFVIGDERGVRRLDRIVVAFDLVVEFDQAIVQGRGGGGGESAHLADFVCDWLQGRRPIVNEKSDPRDDQDSGTTLLLETPRVRLRPQATSNWMPQQDCPHGCTDPGMSWSSILEAWVCMTCQLVTR